MLLSFVWFSWISLLFPVSWAGQGWPVLAWPGLGPPGLGCSLSLSFPLVVAFALQASRLVIQERKGLGAEKREGLGDTEEGRGKIRRRPKKP